MNYFKHQFLLLSFLFISVSGFSQSLGNHWKFEKYESGKLLLKNGDSIDFKQKTIEIGEIPVTLNPQDRYKLNQELLVKPIDISKEIRSDFDDDANYDKSVTVRFTMKNYNNLKFRLGVGGLQILAPDSSEITKISKIQNQIEVPHNGFIKNDGYYKIYLSNNQTIDLEVGKILIMYDNIK